MNGERAELDGDAAWGLDAGHAADGPAADGSLSRLLPPVPVRELRAHEARYGPPGLRGGSLIDEVTRAGLTGRGGAAYPAGPKLSSVRERAGLRGSVVVANGMESEPASAKDASLLARVPHLVLDGIALAAEAVAARSAYLCVRRQAQADMLAAVIAERGAHDPVPVKLVLVPERYVSSAESALVRHLNGGPALPGFTPPRPFERGVRGRPTLVSNVETLANIALISRHGASWFRSVGTGTAPGSVLVTVAGAVKRPGVHEIPLGMPVRDVLGLAGGCAEIGGVQAVLAGGFFGSWLPGGAPLDTPATPDALRSAGASFGAGIFLALPAGGCGLAETTRVLRYLAEQSAGQCGPCVNGLPAIADAFGQLAFGRGPHVRTVRELRELFGLVDGRGACHLPDGVTRLGESALRVFAEDMRRHERGPCPAAFGSRWLPVPAGLTRAPERRQTSRQMATIKLGTSPEQAVRP
ncbi:NADH-ubiquinone oxidoreductase-F iron-sulfur binding region domain-containing protein [Trebonia kvetii]|uniref:NADH-ubiquinone oxidoreductase-F iron-sulfur binding region domain-containing protein n=1 Tax=Trebonia kvetii TaxID=2480626 RepID=UPI00165277CE|nr:NADH-ubiquinone oxidoreductase-F iron-sulfur binding region domain-containing protein [Trebonia kvetii]